MDEQGRLQELLVALGINAKHLAMKIGIQPSTLSNILSGRNKPSLEVLQKLLITYPNISPSWLILGEGNMFISKLDGGEGIENMGASGVYNENNIRSATEKKQPNLFSDNNNEISRIDVREVNVRTETEKAEARSLSIDRKTNSKEVSIAKIIILYSDMTYEIR